VGNRQHANRALELVIEVPTPVCFSWKGYWMFVIQKEIVMKLLSTYFTARTHALLKRNDLMLDLVASQNCVLKKNNCFDCKRGIRMKYNMNLPKIL
jgi:hypothetical protein